MQLSLPAAIGGTVTAVGLVIAAVMYFEEQFKQVESDLGDISTEMATQSQSLAGIQVRAIEAREGREELDDGLKDLRGEFADLRAYVADQLAHHRGEHGRIEGAADTLEGILRRVGHDGGGAQTETP